MFFRLLRNPKYFHLKMIFEHPKGIQNRFKHTGDKWISSVRHPHIKNYSQFFRNKEHQEYEIDIKLTDQEENSIKKIKHSFQPGKSGLTEYFTFYKITRPDDADLQRDIGDMTIKKFIQEGRQNLTQIHKLVIYALAFVVTHVVLYFTFIHNQQLPKNQRVKVLNAEFLQSYHFQTEESQIKQIIDRIQIVNGEFEKRLAESKNK